MNIGVIGGGISGIRAALTLARAGARVTLFEKNQHLGGRVFSFHSPDFGEIDIGQHIWLRCCSAFEQLLRDLAVPDDWVERQPGVAMTYRWPDGFVQTLSSGRLPGGLALLPVLFGARLGLRDKLKYFWATIRAGLYSDQALETLDNISIAHWLRERGQSDAVVKLFWEPFVVGICNGRLEEVSARHGLFAMRQSLLKSAHAAAICLLRCPLSQVFDRQARTVLKQIGVDVRTGASIAEVIAGAPVRVRDNTGCESVFDRVILALPLKRMHALLPASKLPTPPEEGAIAGLLLRFAAPVMDEQFFIGVGSPAQIVFNKSAILRRQADDGSQVIEVVLSAAEREVRLGVERLAAELLPELAKLLPRVAKTPMLARRMLIHGTATFRVKPGGESNRPSVMLPELPGIALAGDYAATGWPSTMESAARAGQAAADALLS